MALAIIGGLPARFAPYIQLYRETYKKAGHDLNKIQLSINSHTYIADTPEQARNELYPPYAEVMTRIGRERGWPPTDRRQFDASTGPQGALLVGSPQDVIDKILYQYELFGHTRFLAQMSIGAMSHKNILHAIELLGTIVAPEVKKFIAQKKKENTHVEG
jgi:alkanesulfonate monooxygenase SsuD/methylene tetrahydromethanopterin reductase-like flavin-dependent oxidoreductase (luciferase family)